MQVPLSNSQVFLGAHRRHHGRIAFPRRPSSPSWPPARCCQIFVFITSTPMGWVVQDLGKHCQMTPGTRLKQALSKPPPPHEPAFPSSQVASTVSHLKSSCTPSLKAHTPAYMLPGPAVGCRATHQTRHSPQKNGAAQTGVDRHTVAGLRVFWARAMNYSPKLQAPMNPSSNQQLHSASPLVEKYAPGLAEMSH